MAINETDGVWRTVGGRRIFIKEGQDLSSAMKESGKFGTKAKTKSESSNYKEMSDRELKDELYHNDRMLNEMERRLSGRYELTDEKRDELERRASHYEEKADEIRSELEKRGASKTDKEKYMDIPQEERVKAYEEGKNWKDLVKEEENRYVKTLDGSYETDNKGRKVTQKEYDEFREAYKNDKISKEDFKNNNYDALKNVSDTKKEEAKTYMQDQYKAFDEGKISVADLEKAKKDSGLSKAEIESARNYVNERAPESYARTTENKTGNTTSQPVPKGAEASKTNESNVRKLFDKDKEYKFNNNVKNETEWKEKNKTILEKGYKEETGTDPYKNGKAKTSFEDYQTWRYGKEADKENKSSKTEAKRTDGNAMTFTKSASEGTYTDKLVKSANEDSKQIQKIGEKALNELNSGNYENAKKILNDEYYHITNSSHFKDELSGTNAQEKLKNQMKYYYNKLEESKGNKNSNDWVRNAFNEYKKEHPKTKMTIEQFEKSKK